jgi:hypothetical protein
MRRDVNIPDDSFLQEDSSPEGVDLTLIRWTLSLTPLARLQFLEDRIHDILKLRELNART